VSPYILREQWLDSDLIPRFLEILTVAVKIIAKFIYRKFPIILKIGLSPANAHILDKNFSFYDFDVPWGEIHVPNARCLFDEKASY